MIFSRRSRRTTVAVVLAVLATSLGGWLLTGKSGAATHRHVSVSGVPLDEVHPPRAAPGERRPGVVVAHGFAGSARLMAQFGASLAARGYVVVLLDFAGHGASTRRLPDATASTDTSTTVLQRDLGVATAHLRGLPDVDPSRIALVGHSMGASAVTRYAAAHPEIIATVALSLPDASTVSPELPARLLLLVGALEFPGFRAEAARAADPGGPDRAMVVVPGVEHISILYAPRTHREVGAWLDQSTGRPPDDRALPSPVRRVSGAAILLLSLLAGLYPVARLLFGAPRGQWPQPHFDRSLGVAAVAVVVVAAPAAALLPSADLPLAVGGYLIGLTGVAGAVLLAYQRRRGFAPAPAPGNPPGRLRLALATPLLIGYAATAIAVPLHLGLTHAVPVGDR